MKIADSFFVNNGDTTKVLLRYPLFENAVYMQTPKNEYRLKNGKVERNDGTGWVIPITDDPNYHKFLILQSEKNRKEEPKPIIKYYWDKIFKQQQGGTMNYAQYLQDGGIMSDDQALELLNLEDAQLAEAIKQNPDSLPQMIEEYGLDAPSFVKHVMDIAQKTNDNDLMKLIVPFAEQFNISLSFKCGGKVRAKVKKACGGKKLEKGSKVPEVKKGGCPCQWKKVGGRLVEVDCNGIPIAKNGTVLKFQQGGVNERNWYNKRYTPEEIKKIQAALNKQALGKQIAVDGIIGPETIAAIKRFQQLHSDILKVDGLVGDQTASALGITGLGNSSLPQTRGGQNQSRKSGIDTSTAQGREDKRASDYYNSPEMLRYLMNASNAATGGLEYINHYYNALNYVSPEVASKLRALNNEGDGYDETASKNRAQAFNRQVGIKEFKNAMASGALKTADDLDRWMTSHNLSKEEMNELMADPSVGDASLTAGVRADNGRVNSQQSLAKRFAKDVAAAESKAGVGVFNSLTPLSETVYGTINDVKNNGISELRPDKWLYNRLNNTILSGYTGSHPTYLTDIVGSTGNETADYLIDVATAPESWVRFGATRNLNTTKVKPTYWKNTVKAGDLKTPGRTYYGGYIEGNPFNRTRMELHLIEKAPIYWKEGHMAGDLKTPGKLKFNYTNLFDGYQFPAIHGVQMSETTTPPVIQEVPKYDSSITYGPYVGENRFKFKNGGNMTYADYLN